MSQTIKQKQNNDCQIAATAMLCDEHSYDDLLDEYGAPMSALHTVRALRHEGKECFPFNNCTHDDGHIQKLSRLGVDMLVLVESPLIERDRERYNQLVEKYDEDPILHAVAVVDGELHDPQSPSYWDSVTEMTMSEYTIHHVYAVRDSHSGLRSETDDVCEVGER